MLDDRGQPVRFRVDGVPVRVNTPKFSGVRVVRWLRLDVSVALLVFGMVLGWPVPIVGPLGFLPGPVWLWNVVASVVGFAGLMCVVFWLVGRASLFARSAKLGGLSPSEYIANERREQRACPACGFSLAGLEADGAGVVQCPECGAGWAGIDVSS